ncbi:hypothetical protein EXIGLDRAFT_789286 [Exidia glandulosa HHB12029]|uniref:Chitin-binding type-1 domain-containing protein n=1 Tax=Exidia glandulosa HHB12029 TaxID=1314781 RepID=A0A165NZS5_EXIGL|nr:hypothetical protein EXIGLDRAFT_789286 [Exidia glandulosa HHB12029]
MSDEPGFRICKSHTEFRNLAPSAGERPEYAINPLCVKVSHPSSYAMAPRMLTARVGIFALVLVTLSLLSLLTEVNAVKSVYLSPRAQRHRHERRREHTALLKKQRQNPQAAVERTSTQFRTPPASRQAPSHPPARRSPQHSEARIPATLGQKSLLGHGHNSHHNSLAHRIRTRQVTNESCNNITITPPGWDGSCSSVNPCPNGACCGPSGFCGYGDAFCGAGCISHCNAVAECGPNAAPGHEECPLNVCCSEFGFCGSTEEFCGAGCIGDHCGTPSIPTGLNLDVTTRIVGYYEGWAATRPCDAWFPLNIPANGYTHLNFAFAVIDPVAGPSTTLPRNPSSVTLPHRVLILGPLPTRSSSSWLHMGLMVLIFSDWEYPVACERGGVPADMENMVVMFKALRSADTFGLTFTAPTSYWYLQHFDILGLLSYADWVNLMAYDLHGVWDAKDAFIGNIAQAHTNLTEIKESITLFQRIGVPLDRIVLGLGYYGRSFQLSDPTCSQPGCPFAGPAPGGPCTASDGTLSFAEIQDILATSSRDGNVMVNIPVYDQEAQVKYVVYNSATTRTIGLATMMRRRSKLRWNLRKELVLVDSWFGPWIKTISKIIPTAKDVNPKDGKTCLQPGCGQTCPSGYVQMSVKSHKTAGGEEQLLSVMASVRTRVRMRKNQVTHADFRGNEGGTGARCSSGHKVFCCDSGLTEDEIEEAMDCAWYGHQSKNCNDNVCPAGTFTKAKNWNGDTTLFHACLMQMKQLCCRPANGETSTNPFNVNDLFPNPPVDGDLTWDLQDDPIDENAPGDGANGIQTTTAFCGVAGSAACDAVFEKGAANTIVKLPAGCGGPYARLHSLELNSSASLPESHASLLPAAHPVYSLQFDFEFQRLAETRDASEGAVLLRIDATTLPGYWDEIDIAGIVGPDSPVKRRALEERWFGSFNNWLSRLNKVSKSTRADLLMQKSFNSVLYSASQNCASDDGTTTFSASLDITCFGSATARVEYGFYLEGQIFPPQINQAYVYASNDGSATLGFEISGKAGITYNTGKVKMIPSINWPGTNSHSKLSYPGIGTTRLERHSVLPNMYPVTIGPELNLYGQLTGSLTLSGTFGTRATYTIPSTSINLGVIGDSWSGDRGFGAETSQTPHTWNINPTADVELDGSLRVDVIPEASLVFNLLPGTPVSVGASGSADLTGVKAHVGTAVDITTGVAGSPPFNFGPFNTYHADWDIYECELSSRFRQNRNRRSLDVPPETNTGPQFSALAHTYKKCGIFDGLLTCPQPSEDIAGAAACAADLADDDPGNADEDDTSDEIFRKRDGLSSEDIFTPRDVLDLADGPVHHPEKRVKVIGCDPPNSPGDLKPPNNGARAPGVKYAREHVYEVQLLTQFISDRFTSQPFITHNASGFCDWVKTWVFKPVTFGQTTVRMASLLAATEPTGRDVMPALFDDANLAKQAFISGKRKFRRTNKINNIDPAAALYLLRAAAISVHYMNQPDVQLKFKVVARKVEKLWVTFFEDYNLHFGNPAPNFDVETEFRDWLNGLLTNYGTNANEFMNAAVNAISRGVTNAGGTLNVGAPKACSATKTLFNMTSLQMLDNSLPRQGIAWSYP